MVQSLSSASHKPAVECKTPQADSKVHPSTRVIRAGSSGAKRAAQSITCVECPPSRSSHCRSQQTGRACSPGFACCSKHERVRIQQHGLLARSTASGNSTQGHAGLEQASPLHRSPLKPQSNTQPAEKISTHKAHTPKNDTSAALP
jgi:hypothetical protein